MHKCLVIVLFSIFSHLDVFAQCNWESKLEGGHYVDSGIWVADSCDIRHNLSAGIEVAPSIDSPWIYSYVWTINGDTLPTATTYLDKWSLLHVPDSNGQFRYCVTIYDRNNQCDTTLCRTFNRTCVSDTSADTIPPSINLIGKDTICIEVGSIYTNSGATAYDQRDGDLTQRIRFYSNEDRSKEGIFYERYVVTDNAGNSSDTAVRTVFVVNTLTPPLISLVGPDTIYLAVDSPFHDPRATALQYFYGDLTDSIRYYTYFPPGRLGVFDLGYEVYSPPNDAPCQYYNYAYVSRTLVVIDTIRPEIHRKDTGEVVLPLNTSFRLEDYIILSDNSSEESALWDSLSIVLNTVDTSTYGIYSVVLLTKDQSGNSSDTFTLTVQVGSLVAIEEFTAHSIALYPNPVHDELKVVARGIRHISIRDVHGTIVYSKDHESLVERDVIQTKEFPSGIYFIQVDIAEHGSFRKMLLVQ